MLRVSQWSAWASGLTTPEKWVAWLQEPYVPTTEEKAPATQVVALLRRRFSPLGRAAIETVMNIYNDEDRLQHTPVIFASRWGDIGLSVKLLRELCTQDGLSPMGFSTSVHNGIGGLFSISQKHRGNIIALSGGETTTSTAFIEALGLLEDGAESVIVVIYEERSPDVFAAFHPNNFTFAWAVRLHRALPEAKGFTLSTTLGTSETLTDTTASLLALQFITNENIESWIEKGNPISYRWHKH